MLEQEDRDKFIDAMLSELDDHNQSNHWKIIDKCNMPSGTKPIRSIWNFKRKRYPDGYIMKYKACICTHGGQQSYEINYWETYSPVVNWISVRLLLTICQLHNLNSESIDFVLAFPQVELDVDIYMMTPQEMKVEAQFKPQILKLEKNLYVLKQVSHN